MTKCVRESANSIGQIDIQTPTSTFVNARIRFRYTGLTRVGDVIEQIGVS